MDDRVTGIGRPRTATCLVRQFVVSTGLGVALAATSSRSHLQVGYRPIKRPRMSASVTIAAELQFTWLATLENRRASLGSGAYAFPPIGGLDQTVLFGLLARERHADTLGQLSAHRLSNRADRQGR